MAAAAQAMAAPCGAVAAGQEEAAAAAAAGAAGSWTPRAWQCSQGQVGAGRAVLWLDEQLDGARLECARRMVLLAADGSPSSVVQAGPAPALLTSCQPFTSPPAGGLVHVDMARERERRAWEDEQRAAKAAEEEAERQRQERREVRAPSAGPHTGLRG